MSNKKTTPERLATISVASFSVVPRASGACTFTSGFTLEPVVNYDHCFP